MISDENLGKVLGALARHKIVVHSIHPDDKRVFEKYILPTDTHYLVQGDKVIHTGNITTIESFALQLD